MVFFSFVSTVTRSAISSAASPSAGLAGDVAGPDCGEDCFGLQGGEVPVALPGDQLGEQPVEPVHGLHPQVGQLVAAVGEHPQRHDLTVGCHHAQARGADRDHRDGVRIQGVGLAVVAGAEEPDSRGELRRDIDDPFAGFDQSLRERTPRAIGALDRPDPVRPCLH